MGPNLRGVVGRRSGTLQGFNFSAPMKAAGIVWSRESLDRYLTDVQASVPGSMMTYPGVPDAAERAAIVSYLETLK
jgi:cytochrome c